jgi:hypothetical protein
VQRLQPRGIALLALTLAAAATMLSIAAPATAAVDPPSFVAEKLWHDYFCVRDETCAVADIDGDGFTDIVSFVKSTQGTPTPGQPDKGDVYVALSDGRTFRPTAKWHDYFCIDNETCTLADVNGDGRADAVAFTRNPTAAHVWVALSNGYGFDPPTLAHNNFCHRDEICQLADLNGDGREDLIAFYRTTYGQATKGNVNTAIAQPGTTPTFANPTLLPNTNICMDNETCDTADVNNDGYTDLIAFVKTTRPWDPDRGDIWVSLGYQQGTTHRWHPPAKWADYLCVDNETCTLADMNGDKRADAVAMNPANGQVWVGLAAGAGTRFDQPVLWSGAGCTDGRTCLIADVNGSGGAQVSDLVTFTKGTAGDVLVSVNAFQRPGGMINTVDTNLDVGLYSAITIGPDGRPIVAYYDASHLDLKLAYCSNLRCNAFERRRVATLGDVGTEPSITVGRDGRLIVAYVSNHNLQSGSKNDLVVMQCVNPQCTNTMWTVYDAGSTVEGNTSIAIGADGLPLIAYETWAGGQDREVKVLHCQNVWCGTATITLVERVSASVATPALTIGADGLGLISYHDGTFGDLKVAHCTNAACTALTRNTIDDAGDAGKFSSITIAGDGLALISYHRAVGTGGQLVVAHCADVACTAATPRTVDSLQTTGWHTSIATDLTGRGVISYHHRTRGDVMIAACHDVACTTAAVRTLDSAGDQGNRGTAVAIGVDGLPFVSWHDGTGQDLKVAHCANRMCEDVPPQPGP